MFCIFCFDFNCGSVLIKRNERDRDERNNSYDQLDRTALFVRYHFYLWTCILSMYFIQYRRDNVVVRASASQSVDLGFISLVESYQKTFKNGIHSFPAWRSAHK